MPRSAYLSVTVMLVGAFTAGCASGSKTTTTPPSIETRVSDAPTAPASSPPVTITTPAAPKTSSPPPPKPSYPGTAQAYAKAVVAAWVAKDLSTLASLTTEQVHEQLIEIPGPLNMDWGFMMCDGAAGSSYCRFRNDPGDVLILRISNSKLGKAHATTEVQLHAIS